MLVFSVESAKKILDEIRSSQIGNVDICYSCVADSPVCCNTVLQSQLANTPRILVQQVVFYDNPPCSGVYTAVSRRMSSASMLRMPCTNSDFGRVALHFACDRDFMVCSYKLMQSILAASPLFSRGALRQDVQQAERSCLLCAVRRSGIYRTWLYRIHSGRCAAEQQRNSACAAVRQHFIFRCRTFAHAQFSGLGAG